MKAIVLVPRGEDSAEREARAEQHCAEVGLQVVRTLSWRDEDFTDAGKILRDGEVQRVAIACAVGIEVIGPDGTPMHSIVPLTANENLAVQMVSLAQPFFGQADLERARGLEPTERQKRIKKIAAAAFVMWIGGVIVVQTLPSPWDRIGSAVLCIVPVVLLIALGFGGRRKSRTRFTPGG